MGRILGSMIVVTMFASGCAALCPTPSAHRTTDRGRIEIAYPVCRKLRVMGQQVQRGSEDKLNVRVRWLNRSQKPLETRLQVIFYDPNRLGEAGAYRWDLHTFPPGQSTTEWTSYTKKAQTYLLKVRKSE